MDTGKLTELLRGTIDPNVRQQAEEELDNMKKIIGFSPYLLQIVMMNDLDMPVRQAGVIYLKNMVTQFWKDAEYNQGEEIPFHIHEQDRVLIRDSMVDAVVHAPELVRVQLAVCIYHMVKYDFPGRWPGIVEKISFYLQNSDRNLWTGALLSLYQLIKNYEYKKKETRGPLNECMKHLLPMMYERIIHLLPDTSENSTLLQKIILKIFFALTQYQLSLTLLTQPVFTQWMEVIRQVADRPVPEEANQIDEDDRPDIAWWKAKKWALHILARIFERYGCASTVAKEYTAFAEWYIKTFSEGIFHVLLKILNNFHTTQYVSPRVLQLSLNYIELGIRQSVTWKLLKPHGMTIIENVIFPLLCYSRSDEELWNADPFEYVRLKADIYEDLVSPVTAAQGLLLCIVRKRKEMLEKTMLFLLRVLNTPNIDTKHKDGVFHMIGTMGSILLKKKTYKDQMEKMIAQYVYPEFQSTFGFMRARACWLLQHFDEVKFVDEQNLVTALNCIQGAFLNENELPVKVEAALALSAFLASQDKVEKLLEPNMPAIVKELLKVIKETENDDLTNVMCKFVTIFSERLTSIAASICADLASTFQHVVEAEDGADEKAITAMGLLSAIETLINCMEENKEIMSKIEPIALQIVGLILTKTVIEYYEEAFSLVYSLTGSHVSSEAWQCYEMMYTVFKSDGFDYFTEMMPALHNFLCIDTPAFMSSEGRLTAMLDICKTMLSNECAEDEQCHAAKLLEVVVLQCQGTIGQYLTSVIQFVVERLIGEVRTTELRTMLLQVIIAALYTSPDIVLPTLEATVLPNSNTPLSTHFIKQWVHDTDCFFGLHDRKVCVLGMCTLLKLGPARIPVLRDFHKELLPSLVLLFQGLKKAYAAKAIEDKDEEDEEDEEDDEDVENEVLESDEDELDDIGDEYLERLEAQEDDSENSGEESDEDDDCLAEDLDETTLESYTTPLDKEDCDVDEYWIFKTVMQSLEADVPVWYNALTENLNDEHRKAILEVSTLADQRRAAKQSKKIEESGGYSFLQTTVPTTFNFGGPLGS